MDEIEVSFSVSGTTTLSIAIPIGVLSGVYDLTIMSNQGKLTVGSALRILEKEQTSTQSPSLTAKGLLLLGKSQVAPRFVSGQKALSILQLDWLNSRLISTGLSQVVCTGLISKSMTMHQKVQIRVRAKLICAEVQRLLPKATTILQSKLTSSKDSLGKVLLTYKG
jgi:hypothetical protein